MTDPVLDIVLMVGGPDMQGQPVRPQDVPRRWRHMTPNALIWRRGGWRPSRGSREWLAAAGPALSFANEYITGRSGPIGLLKATDAERAAAAFRAALRDRPGRLVAIIWLDADGKGPAAKWQALRLRRLVNAHTARILLIRLGTGGSAARNAGAKSGAEGVTHLDIAPPPRAADGTLSAIGAVRLGRQAALAVNDLYPDDGAIADPPRQWLWDSPRYQVWYEGPPAPTALVVSFPFAISGNGFEEPGVASRHFARHGMPCVYIRSARSLWFQDNEILDVADAIRAFAGPGTKIVAYGSSMGAYGAFLLSARLAAAKVIAAAPQYSIDRSVIAERRWAGPAKAIGRFIHDIDQMIAPAARKVVLHDTMSVDRPQIARFRVDDTWEMVNFPFASHQVLAFLKEAGALPLVLRDCLGDGPDIQALRRAARAGRRQSQHYWRELATAALRHGHNQTALAALDRLEAFGGFKRHIRTTREKIAARTAGRGGAG